MNKATVIVRRSMPVEGTYIRKTEFPIRVWASLAHAVPDAKIKEIVDKAAQALAEEMKAEGFEIAEVREASISAGWVVRYEALVYVKHVPITTPTFLWPHMSPENCKKIEAATHVSRRKADKGTGRGVVPVEVEY